jgi:DNA-binding NtrC family response regulator
LACSSFLAADIQGVPVVENGDLNGPQQVLLIDDNPLQLSVREAVLRGAGFQVATATTGESALATLGTMKGRVGAVVTDHLMPGCSGSELVRQIRAGDDRLPIIVLSGLAEAVTEYANLHVIFRVKPLPPAELIELVRSALADSAGHRGAA